MIKSPNEIPESGKNPHHSQHPFLSLPCLAVPPLPSHSLPPDAQFYLPKDVGGDLQFQKGGISVKTEKQPPTPTTLVIQMGRGDKAKVLPKFPVGPSHTASVLIRTVMWLPKKHFSYAAMARASEALGDLLVIEMLFITTTTTTIQTLC